MNIDAQPAITATPMPLTFRSRASRIREGLMLAVLLSSAPCMGLMFVVVAPVLSSAAVHFGGADRGALAAQLIMTLPGIGIIVGGPTTGWLVERLGIRRVLFGCLLAYSVAGMSGMVIDSLELMFAMRFLLGWSASGVATSTMALIGEHYDGEMRGRVLGYQNAAGAGIGLLALLASGAIGEAAGWRAPFALYLLGVVVLVLALVCVPPTQQARRDSAHDGGSLLGLWPAYLLIVLVFVVIFMGAVQTSFLLAADGVTSPAVQSWVLATSSVTTVIGSWAYGEVRPRLGSSGTFGLCLALMGCGLLVAGFSHDTWLTAMGCGLLGLGGGAVGPYVAGALLDRAPEAVRGRAVGFMYTAVFFGDFANPLAMTPLRLIFGIHGAFVVVGAVVLAGAVYVVVRHRALVP